MKTQKKPLVLCFVSILMQLASSTAEAADAFLQNWMSYMQSDLKISQLTLPGTHDSGARYDLKVAGITVNGTAKAQDLTIKQQLDNGVRFLDIRCRRVKSSFSIHHGPVFQKTWFGDDVLRPVSAFLKAHGTETIVMSVKEEWIGDPLSTLVYGTFEDIMSSYMKQYPPSGGWKGWYTGTKTPTVAQARGRIVLLRRFSSSRIKGIDATDWPDNTTFRHLQLRVEDQYDPRDKDEKWKVSKIMLDEAYRYYSSTANPAGMYFTFTSGNGLPGKRKHTIPYFADHIRPKLLDYFVTHHGALGVVAMDHVNPALLYDAVNTNFPAPSDR